MSCRIWPCALPSPSGFLVHGSVLSNQRRRRQQREIAVDFLRRPHFGSDVFEAGPSADQVVERSQIGANRLAESQDHMMAEVVEPAKARLDVKTRHRDAGMPKPLALHRKFSRHAPRRRRSVRLRVTPPLRGLINPPAPGALPRVSRLKVSNSPILGEFAKGFLMGRPSRRPCPCQRVFTPSVIAGFAPCWWSSARRRD